jgi:hypothetical protein
MFRLACDNTPPANQLAKVKLASAVLAYSQLRPQYQVDEAMAILISGVSYKIERFLKSKFNIQDVFDYISERLCCMNRKK